MAFTFFCPVKLIFGQPVAEALPAALAEIGARRVLLLSDPGLAQIGLAEQIAALLRGAGLHVATFFDVKTNPTVADVDAALTVARSAEVEALVAFGGGSVIDVGKAVGLLMTNGGSYADYQWRGQPITRPILPLVAVPTTAGTGSEMTKVTVIEDEETHSKRGVLSPHLFARAAILDPALTASLPPGLTAATGADVLGHAVEAYVGRRANPVTDIAGAGCSLARLASSAARRPGRVTTWPRGRRCCWPARSAGWAFDQSGLGIIHALAGPLSARYALHHGLCIGLLLPYGLAYNLPALGDKRAGLLRALDMAPDLSDDAVIDRIKAWLQGLGLPGSLREVRTRGHQPDHGGRPGRDGRGRGPHGDAAEQPAARHRGGVYSNSGGHPVKLLRIDLTRRRATTETWDDVLSGGRLLTAELLTREVDPGCDPLDAGNPLVFAAGALAGWGISDAGRLSVGAKSPLTGGIKESNTGGDVGDRLANLGYRGLIVTGALPSDVPPMVLVIDGGDADPVRFVSAPDYRGLWLEATAERLKADFGDGYTYLAIGPAGEMLMPSAAICAGDVRGGPYRFAARGGLGAVMGSKGVKALLIRKTKNTTRPRTAEFRTAVTTFHKVLASNPRIEVLRKYGTASTVMLVQSLGGLPTNNFSQGTFPEAERLSGEALYELITARGGEGTPTESCMATCVIQCSNIYPDAAGRRLVAPMEYETLGMCGSNLGIGDPDAVARINRLCNELGLDTIEVGAALGVAAEAGVWAFGDAERAIALLEEIGQGTVLGRLLGQGCYIAGRTLGVRRIPAVKRQAISAYDPRAVKGTGVTYATSPMGGDHTAGLTVFAPVDHHDRQGQVALSRGTQITRAAYDALGLCVFLLGSTAARPELITDMLAAAYGVPVPPAYLAEMGRRVIDLERDFNRRAGLTEATDRLPDFFTRETLAPGGEEWDVPAEELDAIWR